MAGMKILYKILVLFLIVIHITLLKHLQVHTKVGKLRRVIIVCIADSDSTPLPIWFTNEASVKYGQRGPTHSLEAQGKGRL